MHEDLVKEHGWMDDTRVMSADVLWVYSYMLSSFIASIHILYYINVLV